MALIQIIEAMLLLKIDIAKMIIGIIDFAIMMMNQAWYHHCVPIIVMHYVVITKEGDKSPFFDKQQITKEKEPKIK